ncbi:phage holin family protein [Gemmobacter sp. 24YEA27]|uniref:phage holin family protein n=1 Tax=Gemmobacter sp. 24YEA27 TaxID=3040672 RepID=UPI0024B3C898|nr:phage holin family protein [Gemmobacter sp. 24YEA27]
MTDLPPPDPGLIATINQFIGGAATALLAAFSGRAMYHAGEVRARRRPILSYDLIWEIPTAVGMAIAGDAPGAHMGLSREVTVGLIAVLSYLGPRGAGAMVERWASRKG